MSGAMFLKVSKSAKSWEQWDIASLQGNCRDNKKDNGCIVDAINVDY